MISPRRVRLCTPEEERELGRRIRAGDLDARNELVVRNMPLVLHLSRRHTPIDDDLVQEGMAGLVEAASRFDPDLGFRFSTYAERWIKQGFQTWYERRKLVAVPRWLGSPVNRKRLTDQGRQSVRECLVAAAAASEVSGLSVVVAERIEAADGRPDEEAEAADELDAIRAALAGLAPDRRHAVEQYYLGHRTYRDIAAELGISKQAVQVRVARGLDDLAAAMGGVPRPRNESPASAG